VIQERPEQVVVGDLGSRPGHQGIGDPDGRAHRGRQAQAEANAGGDLLRPGGLVTPIRAAYTSGPSSSTSTPARVDRRVLQ
jgi:hypothetical protein